MIERATTNPGQRSSMNEIALEAAGLQVSDAVMEDDCAERMNVAGRAWNVWRAGQGTPIVFLHNGGGTLWNWAHQLNYFRTHYRVIAPDLPGFGGSEAPPGPLTLGAYVNGCVDLFRVLDCERPIVVGNCIGASIALELAWRAPESVRGLALFHVCGGRPMLGEPLRTLSSWPVVAMANRAGMSRLGSRFLYAGGQPTIPVRQQSTGAMRELLAGLESFAIFSEAREKPAGFPPVLLGWGRENRTLDVRWAQRVASWLQPDEFHLFADAGHLLMLEHPERLNQVLGRFAARWG